MLMNLNTLRAFAALCVVYYHITSEAGLDLPISIGTRGVDVFFVISGFIITHAAMRNPDQFFARRLIRIVPFYWAATLAVFAIAWVMPTLFHNTRADVPQLLASLFFIPRETEYAGLFPTLILGWSLNYEMYFYAIFALSLVVDARRAPILCAAAIAAILLAIDASGATHPSILFYARPLVFEFVFGIFAWYLVGWIGRSGARLPARTPGLVAIGVMMVLALVALGVGEYGKGYGLPREISGGIPAFFLVLGTILVETLYGVSIRSRLLYLVGESSYILYLIHPYVVYGILRTLFRHADTYGATATVALITALLAISTVVAVAIHLGFEKPVMEWLRHRLLRPRTARIADAQHVAKSVDPR